MSGQADMFGPTHQERIAAWLSTIHNDRIG